MKQSYNPLNFVVVDMLHEAKTVCNGCKYFEMCVAIPKKYVICPISRLFMSVYLYHRLWIGDIKIPKLILEDASIGILKRILEFDYPTEVKAYILDELNKRGAYQNEADQNEMRL